MTTTMQQLSEEESMLLQLACAASCPSSSTHVVVTAPQQEEPVPSIPVTSNNNRGEETLFGELIMKMASISTIHKQEMDMLNSAFDEAFQFMQNKLVVSSLLTRNSQFCGGDELMSPMSACSNSSSMFGFSPSTPLSATTPLSPFSATPTSSSSGGRGGIPDPEIVKKLKSQYNESTLQQAKISKKRKGYPKHITAILNSWYEEHYSYPYPSQAQKEQLASLTGLSIVQLNNWFSNTRLRTKRRLKKEKNQTATNQLQQQQQHNDDQTPTKQLKKRTTAASSSKKMKPKKKNAGSNSTQTNSLPSLIIPQQPVTPAMVISQSMVQPDQLNANYDDFHHFYHHNGPYPSEVFQGQQQPADNHMLENQHNAFSSIIGHTTPNSVNAAGAVSANCQFRAPKDTSGDVDMMTDDQQFHSFEEEVQNHAPHFEDPHMLNPYDLLKRGDIGGGQSSSLHHHDDPMRISSPSSEIDDYANKLSITNLVGDEESSNHEEFNSIFHYLN